MSELRSRLGAFEIDVTMFDREPELVLEMLEGILISRCECRWDTQSFHYVGVSEHFQKIPNGEMAAKYEAVMELVDSEDPERPERTTNFIRWERVS